MIVEVGGGRGGFKNYMENGAKVGRDFHRNQLDQRIPLAGDLKVFELSISLHDGVGRSYDHITLSFSERHVSNEMLLIAVIEFFDHALFAWPGGDRDRIPIYAEAHRPRLLGYVNIETGVHVERFTHIHIGIGRHDLLSGKAIEPLGYLGPRTDNLKYIDAWQESFNARHGFTSPKNCPRVAAFNAVDVIARHNGHKPNRFVSQQGKRAAFEATLQKEIVELNITTWSGLRALLASHGAVSIVNDGRFGECYSVRLPEEQTATRLRGVFYRRRFIELATEEKLRILRPRGKPAYLEQKLPRKESAHVAALLSDWQQFKALEFRYLSTGTFFYKTVYLPASFDARLTILNDLERSCHGITSHSTVESGTIACAANHLPALQIRNLDGIRERTEMLLPGDGRLDVRTLQSAVTMGSALRRADPRREKIEEVDGSATTDPGGLAFESLSSEDGNCELESRIVQASSVIERTLTDMKERDERCAAKVHFSQIEKRLDCHALLQRLKASHGLNPSLYLVVTAQDGTVRIQCGSRYLTPSAFLTEELGLPWKEAASILQVVHEHQIHSQAAMQNEKVASQLFEQASAEKPLDGEVPAQAKAVNSEHQSVESNFAQNKVSVKSGHSGKAPSKTVGAAYKSASKKSSRRASDYGL